MTILLLLIIIGLLNSSNNRLNLKIKHLEAKLDQIMDHLAIEKVTIDEELRKLLIAGERTEAIRRLREETGMDLLEAKEYAEQLESDCRA